MLCPRRKFLKVVGATAAFPMILRAQGTTSLTQKKEFHMEIKRNGSQPSAKGPADWFTGTVRSDPLFQANAPARASAASVTFEPGARTAWHTHPLGQTPIVTAGCGWARNARKAITLDRFGGLETMKLQSCFAYVPIRAVPHCGGRASACPRR